MKYLITDPCYDVKDHDKWIKLIMNDSNTDMLDPEDWVGRKTDNGVIVDASRTNNGDGSCKFEDGEVGVDSGTVAIIEVADDFTLEPKDFGVIRNNREAADNAFNKACRI